MASLFISYSREDMDFAKKLVRLLEEKGHEGWMDKKRILGGANYLQVCNTEVYTNSKWPISTEHLCRQVFSVVPNARQRSCIDAQSDQYLDKS